MAVKCLNDHQKKYICYFYKQKQQTIKELSENFNKSQRTIQRVLIENGLSTPVARLQDEAYQVMALLNKHKIDYHTLKTHLEKHFVKTN